MRYKASDGGKRILGFIVRLCVSTVVVSTLFVLTQDFHIFPGLYSSFIFGYRSSPPPGVEALATVASDGHTVNVWRVKSNNGARGPAALLFHGNAEHLSDFVRVQRWLKSLGITSYSVEYRGFNGRHSGWPSEEGIYSDALAAFNLLQREERVDPQDTIVLGSSIGTGTAAFVAQKFNVGTLVLLSPYSSLTEVVQETPFLKYLASFLKYRFPSSDYIRDLSDTCVVVAHGKLDTTIPFHHSVRLKNIYGGSDKFTLLASEEAGHNDLMGHMHEEIAVAMENCIDR